MSSALASIKGVGNPWQARGFELGTTQMFEQCSNWQTYVIEIRVKYTMRDIIGSAACGDSDTDFINILPDVRC